MVKKQEKQNWYTSWYAIIGFIIFGILILSIGFKLTSNQIYYNQADKEYTLILEDMEETYNNILAIELKYEDGNSGTFNYYNFSKKDLESYGDLIHEYRDEKQMFNDWTIRNLKYFNHIGYSDLTMQGFMDAKQKEIDELDDLMIRISYINDNYYLYRMLNYT